MKWTGLAAAAVIVLHAVAASAAPVDRDALRSILRAPESKPRSVEDWRALGEDIDVALIDAASDARLVFGARQRALAALGMVGGARAMAYLDGVVVKADSPAPLLSAAVEAYARGFAKDDAKEAQRLAVIVLAHPDWQARRGAARAMGIIGGEGALSALRAQQAKEKHPAVRSAIESALRERPAGR